MTQIGIYNKKLKEAEILKLRLLPSAVQAGITLTIDLANG
jgi:hypothetical protein